MSGLVARVVAVPELDGATVDRLYAIYAAHYDACDPARFRADLAGKDFAILLHGSDGLAGFSTAAHYRRATASGAVAVLFSGDTVIERSAWGEQALSRGFARLAGALHARDPHTPLFWLLISKGHRTYRYLRLFARRFHPAADAEHADLARIASELASDRFGDCFDPRTGVIDFGESHGHLKRGLAEVPAHVAARPDSSFFLRRNPGYRLGHELVCITQLTAANLRSVVRQSFLEGLAHGLG